MSHIKYIGNSIVADKKTMVEASKHILTNALKGIFKPAIPPAKQGE